MRSERALITYLRLFENQPRLRTFMEGAWREFGHVYFLRSAASVTLDEYHRAKQAHDFAGMFISSPEQLGAALGGQSVQPKGRYKFRTIGPTTSSSNITGTARRKTELQ